MAMGDRVAMVGDMCGLEVVVDSCLVGSKRAFVSGDRLIVSPAMYDLISHASNDELRHLLENIKCSEVPDFRKMDFSMPFMTMQWDDK